MSTGIHEIAEAAYHADLIGDQPSLSASIAKILCDRTPLHAWTAHPKLNPNYVPTERKAFDIGTAAHALLLQGESNVEVIVAPDFRTKDAREARDAAYANDRVPLLAKDWAQIQSMVDAVSGQIEAHEADPPLFAPGKAEQTIVWDENGVTCRARIDWLHYDYRACDDLKTTSTSANPESWTRTMFGMSGDIQAAMYKRGIRAVTGQDPEFRFVVVETYPPFALSVVTPAPDALALADEKVQYAIDTWRRCLESDEWPGYTRRICHAESPSWRQVQWLERQEMEAAA